MACAPGKRTEEARAGREGTMPRGAAGLWVPQAGPECGGRAGAWRPGSQWTLGRREASGPRVGGGVRLRLPSQGAVSCPVPRGARAGSSCATRSLVLGIWSPNLRH